METESTSTITFNNVYFPPNYKYRLEEIYKGIKPLSEKEKGKYLEFKRREAFQNNIGTSYKWVEFSEKEDPFKKACVCVADYIKGSIVPLSTAKRKKLYNSDDYILTTKGFVLKEESGYSLS